MSKAFNKGDRVKFNCIYQDARPNDTGIVESHDGDSDLEERIYHVRLDKLGADSRTMNCFGFRLESMPEAVEVDPKPQPVTFRICVNGLIGTTDYPSEEAAKQVAIQHGKDGETFSIFEVCKVSEFRVNVSKSLEAV